MTDQHNIEELKNKIHNKQTREYFDEILRSYYSGLYRATIVMLYTVTISDLFLKLLELNNDYGDQRAISIIDKIKKEQTNDSKSTSWENTIVQDIQDKIKLITIDVKTDIMFLKQKRHLCAHPAITEENILYSPDRETTLSLIILMLKGVFTISPLDRIDTYTLILKDIEKKKKILSTQKLRDYLSKTYLEKISTNNKKLILKKIWAITFNCKSKECSENRLENLVFIDTLIDKNLNDVKDFFYENKNIVENINTEYYPIFFSLLNKSRNIYAFLHTDFKETIASVISEDYNYQITSLYQVPILNSDTIKIFLEENLYSVNFKKVDERTFEIQYANWESIIQILTILNFFNFNNFRNEIIIKFYGSSHSFDSADFNFQNAIKPNLNSFDEEELLQLAELINSNNQIFSRRQAFKSNNLIKERMTTLNIDPIKYNHLENFNV